MTITTLVIWLACIYGGYALGKQKNRIGLGITLGALLGVIGVVIMAVIKPKTP
jgi:hypothetical protein